MKVNCIVEKGSDGLYAVYSDDHIGKSYFGGFGESVSEAKDDFLASIREAIEEESKEGNQVPQWEDVRVCYHYDIPSFFNYFDFINISKFAAYAGINESKMRAYKSGIAYPGEKMTARILKAVRTIGADLSAVLL